jgi:hypothetical protein
MVSVDISYGICKVPYPTPWPRISTPLGFLGSVGRGMEPSIIKQGSAEAGE